MKWIQCKDCLGYYVYKKNHKCPDWFKLSQKLYKQKYGGIIDKSNNVDNNSNNNFCVDNRI